MIRYQIVKYTTEKYPLSIKYANQNKRKKLNDQHGKNSIQQCPLFVFAATDQK